MRILTRIKRLLQLFVRKPANVALYARWILLYKPLLVIVFYLLKSFSAKSGLQTSDRYSHLSCTLTDDQLATSAETICRHVFTFFASPYVYVGNPIDWSGSLFSLAAYDIKFPWELSRFYHGPILAEAYRRSSNESYLNELITQINDWIAANPFGSTPNWMSAMEVSIRACNWCCAISILGQKTLQADAPFSAQMHRSLIEHANYILLNFEYLPIITNHLIADCVGLLYIGTMLRSSLLGRFLLNISVAGIEECMNRQVYADGVSFEGSLAYHRLAAELFGSAALVCKDIGIRLSNSYMTTLWRMFEFAWQYTKPNNLAPQIGDNDNGRLHLLEAPFMTWNVNDHRHLFRLAQVLFPGRRLLDRHSTLFPNGQIAILRSNQIYCIVDAGSNGQDGNAGHCHNDILSFELNIAARDFIVDTGTGCYTSNPGRRNEFRSTRMHNTVIVDGEEQNRIPPTEHGIFWMQNDARVRVTQFDVSDVQGRMIAEHTGYNRLSDPVTHRREFRLKFNDESLSILDEFKCMRPHSFEWNFHLHPSVSFKNPQPNCILMSADSASVEFRIDERLLVTIVQTPYSSSYGSVEISKSIRCIYKGLPQRPFVFRFLIPNQ